MTAKKYQRVLAGFQNGWAKLGNKRFDLVIFTPSHLFQNPDGSNNLPWNREKDYSIAEVRLPYTDDTGNRDNFTLIGSAFITHSPYDPLLNKLEPDFAKSCAFFEKLCHHAGAALPEFLRKRLQGYCPWECKSGASWWIALLAHVRQLAVINPAGVYEHQHTIIRPWLDSIRLIELLKLNTEAPEWFDQPLPQDPPPSDGPFGLDGFRWGTLKPRNGLASTPFRLLTALWNAQDRTVSFRDLAKGVWDDGEINLRNDSRLGSARRAVNDFMEAGAFPFRVRTSPKNEVVTLVESTGQLSAPQKSAAGKKARRSPRPARQ